MIDGAEYEFSRLKNSVPWPNSCASCSLSVFRRCSTCSAPIRSIKLCRLASIMLAQFKEEPPIYGRKVPLEG